MKQLDPTFTSNVLQGSLSPYPATDFVNPGLGNIVRPFGLYVPLYLHQHSHKKVKEKVEEKIIQEGAGNSYNVKCLLYLILLITGIRHSTAVDSHFSPSCPGSILDVSKKFFPFYSLLDLPSSLTRGSS